MLVSGAKMLVPQLREEEEQFLLQQPTTTLNKEGIALPAEKRQAIRELPIRFKRGHLIFMSLLVTMPLMSFWEFTYSDFFGENALFFIVGFSFAMNFVDGALSKAVREELLLVPLSGAVNVVLFIGTLGANDFTDFCEGFFIELLIGIFERLVLGGIIEYVSTKISDAIHWVRTRSWFWNLVMLGGASKKLMLPAEPEDEEEDEEVEDEEQEGTPIEEAMDEIIGCGTTCMSTIQAPFLIYVIMTFPKETQIPNQYGIKESDLMCYLLFGLVIAPFQVMMDIMMNHAVEMKDGVKIYDYMLYARSRWHNRLYRWLFDDPAMDRSIAEPLQSVNHLAFSPQFYFIETYYSWGMLMVLVSISILLRWTMNPFDDPALGFFIVQQMTCNVFLDKIINVIISQLLWKPRENALYRAFTRSVEHSLKRKEYLETQDKFRQWFFNKHTAWTIHRLGEIFTPRARDGYKMKLNQLYQTALALQPTHTYKVPPGPFPPALARAELPDDLRNELDNTDSSDSEEREAILAEDLEEALAVVDPNLAVVTRVGRRGGLMGRGVTGLPGQIGDAAAPEEDAGEWLKMLEFPEELPMAAQGGQGFGPLAALVGRAWLASARRHVMMAELAQNWAHELEQLDTCQDCNRVEDPMVLSGVGHTKGLSLKVTVVSDIVALTCDFEQTYSVPEFPFQDDAWRAFLERHNSWRTLCARCRGALFKPTDGSGQAALPFSPSDRPPVPAAALSDSASSPGEAGAQDTPELTDHSDEEHSEHSEDHSSSDDEDEEDEGGPQQKRGKNDEVPEEWHAVKVSHASRCQILYWAMIARKRVQRRNQWAETRDIQEEEGEGEEQLAINTVLLRAAREANGEFSEDEEDQASKSGSGSGSGSSSSSRSSSISGSSESWRG